MTEPADHSVEEHLARFDTALTESKAALARFHAGVDAWEAEHLESPDGPNDPAGEATK